MCQNRGIGGYFLHTHINAVMSQENAGGGKGTVGDSVNYESNVNNIGKFNTFLPYLQPSNRPRRITRMGSSESLRTPRGNESPRSQTPRAQTPRGSRPSSVVSLFSYFLKLSLN